MKRVRFDRKVVIALSCGHTREVKWEYRPETWEQMWCFKCQHTYAVLGWSDQYKVKCLNCAFARYFGQAKLNAEMRAGKHHRQYPHHEVVLLMGEETQHTWSAQVEKIFTEPLPNPGLDTLPLPPF